MKNKTSIKSRIFKELKKNRTLYLLAIPIIIYFAVFSYAPMCGIIIAFKKYDVARGLFAGEWVGLQYFKEFFNSIYFGRILKNTILISFYNIFWSFPAPIITALLLNELKSQRLKKVTQTITYLPHFISTVVICGMIINFFAEDGIITQLFVKLGAKEINYIASAPHFRSIYIGTGIWQGIGWGSIIYLAALSGVDPQLYEAATIDGAGRFKQLLHVTLPGIRHTIIIMLIMQMGKILSVGYEKIILLYSPSTYETADVISSYVYRSGLGSARYSYATAVGLFQSVTNFILLLLSNRISKKVSEVSLF